MGPKSIHFVAVATCIFGVSGRSRSIDPDVDKVQITAAIKQYLRIKFDDVEFRDGGRQTYGLAYNPDASIVEVATERFESLLPKTRMFHTTLDNASLTYREVRALIAATPTDDGYDIRCCLAPVYEPPKQKFLRLFEGRVVRGRAAKAKVTEDIVGAIADLVPDPVISGVETHGSQFQCGLSRGGRRLFAVTLAFEGDRVWFVKVE